MKSISTQVLWNIFKHPHSFQFTASAMSLGLIHDGKICIQVVRRLYRISCAKNNVWGLLQIHSDENRISDKRILRNQLLCCVQQEFSISIFIISRWLHIIFATKFSLGQYEKLHCSFKKSYNLHKSLKTVQSNWC